MLIGGGLDLVSRRVSFIVGLKLASQVKVNIYQPIFSEVFGPHVCK